MELMEKRVYLEGDLIYDAGGPATHFYVIKRGKCWLTMNDEQFEGYPFAEVDSHFGELELFDNSSRRWAVTAKNKVIAFVLPKTDFLKLFQEDEVRINFLKSIVDRNMSFEAYERDCARHLRRMARYKEKFVNEVNQTKDMLKETIIKLKVH